ncbi:hypothetical protein [Lactococcus protaetiae]|uniref:hypothetical protein n=1 Tax=Lactococcus protaetiae TaxID=2592653 RepID=UPI001CC1F163|nr:hypothetical protein [Lactococcus protaetiae]
MSKRKNVLKLLTTEKKVTNWKMRKVKKVFVYGATMLGMVAGVGGLVYVSTALAASLPTDTTVHWDNDKPLYYEIDQNGVEHPKPMLTVGEMVLHLHGVLVWGYRFLIIQRRLNLIPLMLF